MPDAHCLPPQSAGPRRDGGEQQAELARGRVPPGLVPRAVARVAVRGQDVLAQPCHDAAVGARRGRPAPAAIRLADVPRSRVPVPEEVHGAVVAELRLVPEGGPQTAEEAGPGLVAPGPVQQDVLEGWGQGSHEHTDVPLLAAAVRPVVEAAHEGERGEHPPSVRPVARGAPRGEEPPHQDPLHRRKGARGGPPALEAGGCPVKGCVRDGICKACVGRAAREGAGDQQQGEELQELPGGQALDSLPGAGAAVRGAGLQCRERPAGEAVSEHAGCRWSCRKRRVERESCAGAVREERDCQRNTLGMRAWMDGSVEPCGPASEPGMLPAAAPASGIRADLLSLRCVRWC